MYSPLKRLIVLFVLLLAYSFSPISVSAIDIIPTPSGAYVDSTRLVNNLFNYFWPLIIAFSIVMFVAAGFNFFTAEGKTEKIATATRFLIFGVMGVVVVLLAFSIPFIVEKIVGV